MAATQQAHGKEYETVYVLRPDAVKENVERIATRIDEVVNREGGKLTLVESWGRRLLAYPVKKAKRGVYYCVKYVGVGRVVSELERNLRQFDDVMKYQTVLVRSDVDLQTLTVDPEAVKFEAVEIPADEEPEETIAQALGLVDGPRMERRGPPELNDADDFDDVPNLNEGV